MRRHSSGGSFFLTTTSKRRQSMSWCAVIRLGHVLTVLPALGHLVSGLLVESQGPVFVSEPRSSVEFSNETGALLQCVAQGSPPPRVDWLHGDGSPLAPVPHIRELLANGSLHFPPFGAESYRHDVHSAVYRCEASNAVGRILSREVNVRAVVKQHYDVQVHDSFVLNGNTAVLKCEVPAFVKDHVAITSWVQDSSFNIYPTPDSDGKYHMLPSGELVMYSVTPGDSHSTYRCRTVHHVTGKSVESLSHGRVVVTEHRGMVAPRFNERLVLGPVRDGETVALSCVSQGYPPPTYWWHRDTGDGISEVVSPNERTHLRDGVLVLENVHAGDAGRYVCLANNSAGSERVELELSIVEPVSVHVSPQQVTVDLDRGTEFTCTVSGRPHPVLSWTKDGQSIRDSDAYRVRIVGANGSRLQLSVVTREDRGMYQCFAKNDFEMVQSTAELRLGDAAPQLVYKFIEQTMQPGPSVSLKCIAAGNPTPHFTWSLDGFPLPHIDRLMIGQYVTVHGDVISHVNVSSVRVEDGGEYQCLASNRVGSSEHSARLNIYGLPHVRTMSPIAAVAGKDLVVKCPVAGFPISAISWEKDGQSLPIYRRQEVSTNGTLLVRHVDSASDRGSYKCTARNKQGHHDSKTVHIDVKVPPKIEPFSFPANIQEGARVHLTCVVSQGDTPLNLEWLKEGRPLAGEEADGATTYQIGEFDLALRISSVAPHHNGNYTCVAWNEAARSARTALLLVHVPPRWLVEPQDVQAAEGVALFSMNCQAEGFPLPSIAWRRAQGMRPGNYHDIDFGGSQGFRLQSNGSLLISRLGEEHEGYYLCEAVNGIGSGLSKIIYLTVNAPAHFLVKQKNQTARLGSITTLQCKVQGDNPLKIVWRKAGSTIDLANTHYRFNVKDVNISGGLASELTISNTDRSDGGRYACFASNSFGRDQMSVHLYVQEPPEFPRNVHVIEKGSRLVKLGWLLSPDGNSPITKYTVEYKTESDLWHDNMLQLSVSGSQANALVTGLRPATTYHFRLFAENQLGRSQPSDVLDVTTDGEAPGGAPRNVQVEATSSTELQVTWEAPESQLWNGDILGYHVGYKEQRVSADQYQYRSVENRLDISSLQRGEFILTDLMKFTSYSIVLQAYNALGPGPATQEIVASTLEDVPSAPPSSVACTALTSQSLQVSWDPPPHAQLHGLLKGYKLLWENTQQWETSSKPETKITTGLTVVVHGLEKHNNYSIQVLAFTRVGDGVPSTPLFCMTEEDVPEAPAGIKTVVSSGTSIIVSWLPPLHSNGIITTYNLQIRILSGAGQEAKMFRRSVPPQSTSYEAEGLLKRVRYEFVVAAVTRVGEGPSSDPVSMSPSTEVKAAIYSFGILIVVPWKQETRLPCRHVGKPDPRVNWKQWGQPLKLSARLKVAGDGALVVTDLRRDDSGNFSCHVENRHGSDHITHKLIVQVPPSAPLVHSTGSTTNSMTVQWKQGDDGGAPIRGFVLHYKEDQGEWEEVKISRLESSYVLDKLLCGTSYQMYVTALNSIGMGPPSETVVTTTDGGKPGHVPPIDHFLHINSTFVTLFLGDWADGGCPILYFEVEYKTPEQEYWTSASNNLQMQKSFTLNGLIPGTEYHLLVKAHNNAGAVTAEYRFQTLNKLGGTVSPSWKRSGSSGDVTFYLEPKLIIPLVVSIVAVLLACFAVYYCLNRRKLEVDGPLQRSGGSLHVSQTAAVLDNKQNMEQREQYYATVRKPLRSPVREMATLERIPEYSEDIYPYATFELNESASGETRCTSAAPIPVSITPSGPTQLHTFVYHDPRLSAADTLQVRRESDSEHYSKVRGARSRRKSKSFKSESEEYDSLGSDSDTEQGTSSRTESSNHLDDPGHPPTPSPHPLPSKDRPSSHRARGHNFVFRGPESSTSTEPSPTFERKSFPRRARSKMLQLARYSLETSISKSCGGPRVCGSPRFKPRRGSRDSSSIMAAQLDPPSGFSDALELSEAECDLDPSRRAKRHHRSPNHSNFGIRDFTIAV